MSNFIGTIWLMEKIIKLVAIFSFVEYGLFASCQLVIAAEQLYIALCCMSIFIKFLQGK